VRAADYAEKIQAELNEDWLPQIYRERILKLRTRAYHFGELTRRANIEIQHTLLGVELKVGRRRLLCPDLATARYLSVFARVGCQDVAVPYDITKISLLADQLESSWYRMLVLADYHAAKETDRLKSQVRGLLIAGIVAEVSQAGPGTEIPQFKARTKQRKS